MAETESTTAERIDVLAVMHRIAKTNSDFASCPEARAMPSMLAKQAADLRAVRAAVADLIDELHKAHLIIRFALNKLEGEAKTAFIRDVCHAGLDGAGVTRANEREALLNHVGGAP